MQPSIHNLVQRDQRIHNNDLLAYKVANIGSASFVLGVADFNWSLYQHLRFNLWGWRPSTTGAILQVRVSTDGGGTFKSANNTYQREFSGLSAAGTAYSLAGNDTTINLVDATVGQHNSTSYSMEGEFVLYNVTSTLQFKNLKGTSVYASNTGLPDQVTGYFGGAYVAASDFNPITGLQFFYNTGTIAAGAVTVTGVMPF